MNYSPVEVAVWGDFACFTRPEMKVERVSYDVITPSAARGILESIFWKPEFFWRIRAIHVLRPIRHISLVRNEVTSRVSYGAAKRHVEQGGATYYAEADRAQRHTLGLRDVAYRILADVVVRPGIQEDEAKYRDQFQRRVSRGQCYIMPYLGCREFTASFGHDVPPERRAERQPLSQSLGHMLFDLEYHNDGSGRGQPRFFSAEIINGVVTIPDFLYQNAGGNYVS